MSFLSEIFGSKPAPAPTEAPAAPAAQQPVAQQQAQPDDPYAKLWETNPEDNKDPKALDFNIDTNKLAEIAGKLDYSQVITPEMKQQLAAGGEDAVNATMEIINQVQRIGYQQNAMATTKLIEAAVKSTESRIEDVISKKLKLAGLDEALSQTNPKLEDPKYAPIVNAVKQQLVTKYPNASKSEITKMTVNYLKSMAADMNPDLINRADAQAGTFNKQQDTDWSAWLES